MVNCARSESESVCSKCEQCFLRRFEDRNGFSKLSSGLSKSVTTVV